jgi:glutamyl-Q tRNA(Asp) synthetase
MIVTRFAPSPTGLLHLGHAFAALTAREAGDNFLLRLEDLDRGRSRDAFIEAIYRDLKWLGLSWGEPALRQSRRDAAYAEALAQLTRMGLTYPCFCTRKDIADEFARAGEAQHGPDGPIYPGTCRHLKDAPYGGWMRRRRRHWQRPSVSVSMAKTMRCCRCASATSCLRAKTFRPPITWRW